MNVDFKEKNVVVTGATGSLGNAVVKALLESNAHVHVPVRGAESLGRFEMARNSGVTVAIDVDLGNEDAVRGFYEGLPELWASVHCAGGFAMTPFAETAVSDIHRMVSSNFRTCFLCCREALRRIRVSAGQGRIVNVAARQAVEPRTGAGMVPYTASKAAVTAMTEALAEEIAGEGIWVNAVLPSVLDTPANREALPDADHDEWATPDAVAATIAYLASPQNESTRGALVTAYGRS
jgi:NAD(P)-dependent dehydrogenase (short-subunit alcohol dehydrogenase family)